MRHAIKRLPHSGHGRNSSEVFPVHATASIMYDRDDHSICEKSGARSDPWGNGLSAQTKSTLDVPTIDWGLIVSLRLIFGRGKYASSRMRLL